MAYAINVHCTLYTVHVDLENRVEHETTTATAAYWTNAAFGHQDNYIFRKFINWWLLILIIMIHGLVTSMYIISRSSIVHPQ